MRKSFHFLSCLLIMLQMPFHVWCYGEKNANTFLQPPIPFPAENTDLFEQRKPPIPFPSWVTHLVPLDSIKIVKKLKVQQQRKPKKRQLEQVKNCTIAANQYQQLQYPENHPEQWMFMQKRSGHYFGEFGKYSSCEMIPDAHYCLVYASFKRNPNATNSTISTAHFGLCMPIPCDSVSISDNLLKLMPIPMVALGLLLNTSEVTMYCPDAQENSMGDKNFIAGLIVVLILVFAALCGSIVEWLIISKRKNKAANDPLLQPTRGRSGSLQKHNDVIELSLGLEVIKCFSVQHNLGRLFSTNQKKVEGYDLNALNGLRVISICWVLLGHSLVMVLQLYENSNYMFGEVVEQFWSQLIIQGPYSVDTFFFLSGFLASYFVLQEFRKKEKLQWTMYYIHRFLRLTPIYMFWIFIYTTMLPQMGNGPLWPSLPANVDACEKYWWRNLLYINNFWSTAEMCHPVSWYMGNDMQLAIILPILVFVYYKKPKVGWLIILMLTFGSLIARIALAAIHHWPAGTFPTGKETGDSFNLMYQKPWTRMPPYLTGIGLTFVLDHYSLTRSRIDNLSSFGSMERKESLILKKLPTFSYVIGWLLTATIMLFLIFIPYDVNKGGYTILPGPPMSFVSARQWPIAASALYLGLGRWLWSLGLAYITFVCAIGQSQWVKSILGHPLWVPLARLTFQVYLVHVIWLYIFAFGQEDQIPYSTVNLITIFMGLLIMSFILAVFGFLLVEKPFMNLESLLIKRCKSKSRKKLLA